MRQRPPLLAVLLIGCSWFLVHAAEASAATELRRFSRVQPHMGVEFEIVLYAASEAAAEPAFAAAFERIKQLDTVLSDYSLSSELSRLSATAPSQAPVKLSDDLFQVLRTAQDLAKDSGGAFDVTVGPLTKLWRRARRQKELPEPDQLKTAHAAVGHRFLKLNAADQTAALERPGMRLDLGGIAKGYAVDQALAVLVQHGFKQSLVRASGDIAAGEPPPGETGWRIGLAPLNPDDPPTVFVSLKDQAISTSGESRQHLVVGGRRYSHLIDPRNGQPLTGRMSVTVIAPRGTCADSLASAIAVLGPEKGLKLIAGRKDVAAYIVTADDDGGNERVHASAHFPVARQQMP